ncbi:MAG: hypothetical protein DRP32_05245 [Thermotogae bacterium]|nr:MAG: hypothetical protein DRP32_05245 [Thermotogota bacterium]
MLIDSRMMFIDDVTLAAGLAAGDIDLYGQDIPIVPDSELPSIHARGTGSPVLVHTVITADPADGTVLEGDWTVTLSRGSDGTTFPDVVTVVTVPSYLGKGRQGAHMVFAIPYGAEARYFQVSVDASGVTGMGTTAKCSSWLFAQ